MLLKKKRSAGGNNPINIPVRVTGFVEKEGNVGVTGVSLIDQSELTVFLTTTGKMAENKNRNSLKKLQDGYKIGRTKYTLVEGGIVSFKSAWKHDKEGCHFSSWANVLAHNPEDAEQFVGQGSVVTLQMFERDGRHSGVVHAFETDPAKHVTGSTATEIQGSLEKKAQGYQRASFLFRLLDNQGDVVYCDVINKSYNTDAGRDMTPAEVAAYAVDRIIEAQREMPGTTVNVIPADRYTVSPKSLTPDEDGKSQIKSFAATAKAFITEHENGDVELMGKECWFKMGGDDNEFVNAIYPNDPYGPGVDPALLGNLKYSPSVLDEMAAEEQAQPAQQQAQPEPAGEAPAAQQDAEDPFNDLGDEEGFGQAM